MLIKSLRAYIGTFFGLGDERGKITWLGWDTICKSKEEGG